MSITLDASEAQIRWVRRRVEEEEASYRAARPRLTVAAGQTAPRDSKLERIAREVEELAGECLSHPDDFAALWRTFCFNAVAHQFADYEEEGARLRDRFDRILAGVDSLRRLAGELERDGYVVPSARQLGQVAAELRDVREQTFGKWPVPLAELWRVAPGLRPAWLPETTEAVLRLADLPADWDSYGARRVAPEIALKAAELLAHLARPETPRPAVVPTVRGGVQIEWHLPGVELELDFLSPGRLSVSFEPEQPGEGWERELTFRDLGPLQGAVAELSHR
jgi:hypothetical protein